MVLRIVGDDPMTEKPHALGATEVSTSLRASLVVPLSFKTVFMPDRTFLSRLCWSVIRRLLPSKLSNVEALDH